MKCASQYFVECKGFPNNLRAFSGAYSNILVIYVPIQMKLINVYFLK